MLEEIVVTAQRRAESAQTVSIAVTAFSAEGLKDKAVVRLDDLQFASPALTITDAGLTQSVNIRGIGLASGNPAVTNGVATYVDGVFQPPVSTTGTFYDMAGVEVLRGPQGTFVGSSSTGGAIFINSRSPELDNTNGYAQASLGNYSSKSAEGAINVPAGDTLALRFAGNYRKRDSYYTDVGPFHNTPGELEEAAGRIGVLWKPTASFQALLKSELVHRDTGGYANRPSPDTTYAPLRSANIRQLTYDDITDNDERGQQSTLELRQEIAGVTVRYLGGYQDKKIYNLYDSDASIQPLPPTGFPRLTSDQYVRERVFTHEVNVISPTDGVIDWIVGGYWQRNKIDVDIEQTTDGNLTDLLIQNKKTLNGLFGQIGYKIAPGLKLNVGARYSTFEVSGSGAVIINRNLPFPPFNGVGLKVADLGGSHDDGRATGKVAMEWTPNDTNLIYGFVARGYKPGGSNSSTDEFAPETVLDYELGWKATLLDGQLRTQLGLFWYDYQGFQQDLLNPDTGQSRVFNMADATVRGIEAQAQARIGGWGFDVGAAYIDSELSEARFVNQRILPPGTNLPQCAPGTSPGNPPVCFDYGPYTVDSSGGDMLYSPEFTFNAGIEYTFDIGAAATLRPRVNYAYIGDQFTNLLYSPVTDTLRARGLVSAQVTFALDRWSVEAYGTNLADKEYISGQGGGVEYYGAPREYGIRTSFRF